MPKLTRKICFPMRSGLLCLLVGLVKGCSNRVSRSFLSGVRGVEKGRDGVFVKVEAEGQEKTNGWVKIEGRAREGRSVIHKTYFFIFPAGLKAPAR